MVNQVIRCLSPSVGGHTELRQELNANRFISAQYRLWCSTLDGNAGLLHPVRMVEPNDGAVPSPGSTASLRPANQRRVLDLLRGTGSTTFTQAELARATGLASGTISNIVRDLSGVGLVETERGGGRRGTVVRLSRSAGLVAGVDIGHTHLTVALADLSATIVAERREPLRQDHDHSVALDLAAQLLEQVLAVTDHTAEDLRTVGLGLPAPVAHGEVRASAILPGWTGVAAAAAASDRLGKPVQIDNDANLGALAEHRLGAGRGERDLVFVKVSSGVGAGLVVNGQICRGALGTAGEIGHLTLDEQGPLCRCGSRGCLEAYASTETIVSLVSGHLPGARIGDVIEAAAQGDAAAARLIEDAGLSLGWGLASVVNLINPGKVVIGGDLVRAGDLLLDSVRIGLRRHALADAAATPVVPSMFGERAPVVGAVLLAADGTELVA
jgi:predicted NBD/HSP70 family sugar kinase